MANGQLAEELQGKMEEYRDEFGEQFPMWCATSRLEAVNKIDAAIERGRAIDPTPVPGPEGAED